MSLITLLSSKFISESKLGLPAEKIGNISQKVIKPSVDIAYEDDKIEKIALRRLNKHKSLKNIK